MYICNLSNLCHIFVTHIYQPYHFCMCITEGTMSLCKNSLTLAYKDSSQHNDTNSEVMMLLKEAGKKKNGARFATSILRQVCM